MTPAEKATHSQWFLHYRDHGDMAAFERLLDCYNKPLFNYILRLLNHNREDAEDALQEVWGKVIKQAKSYQDKGNFSSWLYRIAHNHCLDLYRRRNVRTDQSEVIENDDGYQWLEHISSDNPSPLEDLAEKEFLKRLDEALLQVPERIREVYILRSMHEIPFKEIAEIQDAPLGTVLSRMSQAVKQLKQLLSVYHYNVDQKVAGQG